MSENLTTNVELDSTANGTVSFATDVVATIAGLAATEVEGVAAMINNGNLGLVDMLRKNQGNRTMTRGVKVEINGNQVRVQQTVFRIEILFEISDFQNCRHCSSLLFCVSPAEHCVGL